MWSLPRFEVVVGLALCFALVGCNRSAPEQMKPTDRANGLYLRGTAELLQGNLKDALRDFDEVRKLTPKDPRLPVALGEVYFAMGKSKKAMAQFDEAVKHDPKRPATWSRIGQIQMLEGQLDAAKHSLLKALALAPNDYAALESLGDLALMKKDAPTAARQYALAASLQPDPGERTRLWLEGVHALEGDHRSKDAIAYLRQALARGEQSPQISGELGNLLVGTGDFPGAVKAYQAAARDGAKDPAYWQLVGELEARMGKLQEARNAFRESLRVQDRSVVHVALGKLALRRGNRPEAKAQLASALKVADGASPYEAPELAGLMEALGQKKNALVLLEEASSEPDHAQDVALQRRTAKLAKALGEAKLVTEACARVAKAGDVKPCP